MILLDTTVLIDIFAGNTKATKLVRELSEKEELCTSSINIYEISKGIYSRKGGKKKYLDALELLIANIYTLPLNKSASIEAAKIYGELKEKGVFIDEPDYSIAGSCRSNKIGKIVTKNTKHFKKIKGLHVIGY